MLARARSAIGHGTLYKLGKGGFNPASPHPWNALGECDCSGYAAWCLGVSRHTEHPFYAHQNGGWLETSAIVADAHSSFGMFEAIRWEQAQPGDLLVYGDSGGHQGHVGVVSEVNDSGPTAACHCSSGNARVRHDAIQETGVAVWSLNGGIVARPAPSLVS